MAKANKTYILYLLLVCVSLAGCSKRPKEILSEKQLVRLMADMELAESYSNIADVRSHDSEYRLELGKSVLAAHGITQEQLDTTLSWYGRNLDDYSELYAKVDKEILERKKKLLKMTDEEIQMEESDILWKYGKNGLLSDLGTSDGWILSVTEPELQQGDRLLWSMHIDNPVQLNGVLGVEYADGTSEAVSSVFIGKNKLELDYQTDTAKVVKRIYGSIRLKDNGSGSLPIFADSINLVRLPFDSMEYRIHRNVKRYGIPSPKKKNVEEKVDSISLRASIPSEEPPVLKNDEPIMWSSGMPADVKPKHAAPEGTPSVTSVHPGKPFNPSGPSRLKNPSNPVKRHPPVKKKTK